MNQNVASVNILILSGSNLEIGDIYGNTPLMLGILVEIINIISCGKQHEAMRNSPRFFILPHFKIKSSLL